MLSIDSNIGSLITQEHLVVSGNALSQAITRLSSGRRINSAADDAAGLAISTSLQTAINSLNQGVSNANDGVSMVQAASTGLAQITQSLQTIRQLANEAVGGALSASNRAALQQEAAQQIAEVNRVASQTTYNGLNLLDGTAGLINVQVGANVGQTVPLDLSRGVSAALIGGGFVQAGDVLGTLSGLNLNPDGSENTSGLPGTITQINVVSNGSGGFAFTDQNGQVLSGAATANLFSVTSNPDSGIQSIALSTSGYNGLDQEDEIADINGAAALHATVGAVLGTLSGISVDPATGLDVTTPGTANVITSITVEANGQGGFTLLDQNGNPLTGDAATQLFAITTGTTTGPGPTLGWGMTPQGTSAEPVSTFDGRQDSDTSIGTPTSTANAAGLVSILGQVNINNRPTSVANVDVSTTAGANLAMETADNALASVNDLQATLGAAQNRLTGVAMSQQDESTDLSDAQSQITDADFAQETANLSKAQVLQQASISMLAQANALPEQVLKLLQ